MSLIFLIPTLDKPPHVFPQLPAQEIGKVEEGEGLVFLGFQVVDFERAGVEVGIQGGVTSSGQ